MALTTVDLSPRIGTEIKADAATLLSGEYAAEIVELLEQRGVLIVKELHFDKDQQSAFSKTLGKIQERDGSSIFKVSIDPNENPGAEYLKGSFYWHIDGATDEVPNFAATLNAKVLSTTGGTTYFANTYAAYADLPAEDQEVYDQLRVVHSLEAAQRFVNPEPGVVELGYWQARTPKIHPLVWKHKSGRKSLVLGATAEYIEGMDPAKGRALLAKLREWSTQPQFVYSHDWNVGDFLIWDNSGTMHRVDEYPLEDARMLHRTTIEAVEELV